MSFSLLLGVSLENAVSCWIEGGERWFQNDRRERDRGKAFSPAGRGTLIGDGFFKGAHFCQPSKIRLDQIERPTVPCRFGLWNWR
jgi:hypothetical protein